MGWFTEERIVRITTWLLRFSGIVICCALVPVFFPVEVMNRIHQSLGLGELPTEPIVVYMARSLSAMYFAHGVVVCFVSGNVRRYWPFVRLLGTLNIVLGLIFLGTDWLVPMPLPWTLTEGPPIIGFGVILLWLDGLKKHCSSDARDAAV